MDIIINFYKELDAFNLIIFWGIIIVITLLLLFSIIISNKNKKLKQIIKNANYNSSFDNIPINNAKEDKEYIENLDTKSSNSEEKFVAEEYIIDYQNKLPSEENHENILADKTLPEDSLKQDETNRNIIAPSRAYQKNILKEMSLSQTSPIGIDKPIKKEQENAQELHETLIYDISQDKIADTKNYQIENNLLKENNQKYVNTSDSQQKIIKQTLEEYNDIAKTKIINSNILEKEEQQKTYLEDVSKHLFEANQKDKIKRTEYELKQEEDAIISYEELMKKKDTIKIIDEEDAVISIDELVKKNKQQEKLYNLTENIENDKFIKELKNFREDLH